MLEVARASRPWISGSNLQEAAIVPIARFEQEETEGPETRTAKRKVANVRNDPPQIPNVGGL